jgi:hypothetical protein
MWPCIADIVKRKEPTRCDTPDDGHIGARNILKQ